MGGGKNKRIYTHPPQECVKIHKETPINKMNNDQYQNHSRGKKVV